MSSFGLGMNQEHRNALRSSHYEICQDLDAESVLTYLFAKDILQKGHVDEIRAIPRGDTRNMQLMKFVVEGGPSAFNEFINALKISGKGFLADKILAHLQPSQAQGQTHSNLNEKLLTKHLNTLCKDLVANQVISLLEAEEVITSVEGDDLRKAVERSAYSGNERVISLVRKRLPHSLPVFHSALRETGQPNLANLLLN